MALSTLQNGTITVTTTSGTDQIPASRYIIAFLNVTAVSGTTPSMSVKLQDSPDGTTWYDVPGAAFTAATATGTQRLSVTQLAPYVRAVSTVTGTTPSFTYSLKIASV